MSTTKSKQKKPAAKKPAAAPVKAASPDKADLVVCKIADLAIDSDLQQRAGGVDKRTVSEYSADLLDGVTLPPIDAVEITEDGDLNGALLVWDGFQRIEAHTEAGLDEIKVSIRKGTYEDAVWLSCAANKGHGLRRRPEDKRKAIASALMLERSRKLSDRQIAEHCGGSPTLVGTVRKELVEAGAIAETTERISKAGKTINTSAEANQKRVAAGKASAAANRPAKQDDDVVDDADVAAEEGVSTGADSQGTEAQAKAKPSKVTASVNDGVMLDANDAEVPEELHDVFKHVDNFHKIKRYLEQLADNLKTLAKTDAGVFFNPANADLLELIASELLDATPYVVSDENGLGWMPTNPEKIEHNKKLLTKK